MLKQWKEGITSIAVAILITSIIVPRCDATAVLRLPIDPNALDATLPFEGLGALSAGADAALLFDYDEMVRDRVLDLLFTPHFPGGASLQILKVWH